MAAREYTEKLKVTIKAPDGVRVDYEAKGSVVAGIVSTLQFMDAARRERLITRLQDRHAEMLTREADRAQLQEPGL